MGQFFDQVGKLAHCSITYDKALPHCVGLVAAPINVILINDSLLMCEKVALLEEYSESEEFGPADQIDIAMPDFFFPQVRTGIEVLESIAVGNLAAMALI